MLSFDGRAVAIPGAVVGGGHDGGKIKQTEKWTCVMGRTPRWLGGSNAAISEAGGYVLICIYS